MNEFKIKKYQYLFFSVFIILFAECLAVSVTTDNNMTDNGKNTVSLSWFVKENDQEDELTEKLTLSFQDALTSADCFSVVDRLHYNKLRLYEKNEKEISDIEGIPASNREKQGKKASDIVVFGQLQDAKDVVKVTVRFKYLNSKVILYSESVYPNKNTLEDIKSIDQKMAELVGKICKMKTVDANANGVCENIKGLAFKEKYPGGIAQFEKELTIKAEKEAIRRLVSVELDKLRFFSSLEREDIVESLRPLLLYDGIDRKKNVQKTISERCFKLRNPNFNRKDIFEPVFIGRVCHFNSNFLEKRVNQLQQNFILTLKAQYRGKKNNISSILSMPNFKGMNFEGLKNRSYEQLSRYVHQDKAHSNSSAIEEIEELQCIALYVYPVELHTESTLFTK